VSDTNGRSPEERREIRNARSRPLLGSLKQWLEETLVKLSKKSDTGMAVRYALGRWEALMRHCDDGRRSSACTCTTLRRGRPTTTGWTRLRPTARATESPAQYKASRHSSSARTNSLSCHAKEACRSTKTRKDLLVDARRFARRMASLVDVRERRCSRSQSVHHD
jgi:Transposase IS66 family